MPKCDYCGSTILFGGVRDGEFRFCNENCHGQGVFLSISRQIPESVIQQAVWEVHRGVCPKCQGPGPVDVHTSHRVWSALLITSWRSIPNISCRRCGLKSQLGDALFSLFLGWWGFPWGLFVTPVQIVRNFVSMVRGSDPTQPSAELTKIVRLSMASEAVAESRPGG